MQIPRPSGAAALPSTLLPLLLLLPGSSLAANPAAGRRTSASAADRSVCVRSGAVDLSLAAACGDKGSLENCFRHVPSFIEPGDLELCFRNAGCTTAEAGIEARYILHNCDESGQSAAELRRRDPEPIPAPTPAPIPVPQDTTAATSPSATAGAFTPTIQCSTEKLTKTNSCPIQSTGTDSGSTLPCFETEVPTQVCAAENICSVDKDGNNLCMRRKDSLDTGALIVTIFLAVCFAVGFATLIFFCCRDKREERKLRARQKAAQIAKASALSKSTTDIAPQIDEVLPTKRDKSPAPGGNPFADGTHY
ncbi:uncharacterized protein F4822DRAFT_435016 [Hypoxylon trugodes]|uniref:uncharacterized protein n=1 Tax=Hypoxylon trugodes TaxID=326681 RepID=UPI002192957F|nr:uncharacterized protein F4822DRAFT_435016 [Hypoxylon trugodes]KAI1383092.1 hypothetical protein F4822DRAFT_435016 [Hypoxylon trugodes]